MKATVTAEFREPTNEPIEGDIDPTIIDAIIERYGLDPNYKAFRIDGLCIVFLYANKEDIYIPFDIYLE